jgi:hypothetical protein
VLNQESYMNAIVRLKSELSEFKAGNKTYDDIVPCKQHVFIRYQPVFSYESIPKLSKEDFISFLSFKNNCHWTGLERKGRNAANDLELLHDALRILLNEDMPIQERLPQSTGMITGMGKAIATSILLVAYPQKYGVWNGTSEAALKKLFIFPSERLSEGFRYKVINDTLQQLSADLATDLWTLDALWWHLLKGKD